MNKSKLNKETVQATVQQLVNENIKPTMRAVQERTGGSFTTLQKFYSEAYEAVVGNSPKTSLAVEFGLSPEVINAVIELHTKVSEEAEHKIENIQDEAEQKVESLNQTMTQLREQISAQNQQLTSLRENMRILENNHAELNSQYQTLEIAKQKQAVENEQLKERLTQQIAQNQQQYDMMVSAQKNVRLLETQLSEATKSHHLALTDQKNKHHHELTKSQNAYNELLSNNKVMANELQTLKEEKRTLEQNLDVQHNIHMPIKHERDDLKVNLARFQGQLETTQHECERLQLEQIQLLEDKHSLNQQLGASQALFEQSKHHVLALEKKLDHLKNQHDKTNTILTAKDG